MGRVDPDFLVVGHLNKPHGTKGELFVWPLTDHPESIYAPGVVLLLGEEDAKRRLQHYLQTLQIPEIEVISVKISTLYSQVSALAREHSEDSSAERGGDLGEVGRGIFAPPYENAAFQLAAGAVSDVVETDFGYHVIQRVE